MVAEGPAGIRSAGRFRLIGYEVRRLARQRHPGRRLRDREPATLSEDPERARWLLDLVPELPTPVWGRDELRTGEMLNSNSFVSWLLVRSGLDVSAIHPPAGGRVPGWHAGIVVAQHQIQEEAQTVSAVSQVCS